jgi:hypothetical protein
MLTKFWWENLEEGDHLEDLGINAKSVLKLALEKRNGRICTMFAWLRLG